MPNLTPSPSVDNACLVVLLPASLMKHAIGAIAQLAYPDTWEAWGETTPDQAAYAFIDALAAFSVEYGVLLMGGDYYLTTTDGKLLVAHVI